MNRNSMWIQCATLLATAALVLGASQASTAEQAWVVYEGQEGPGQGKHVVLISGDEEYRSEETMPQLGRILAKHHGFKTTVLFAIDPDGGMINPDYSKNIPGLEHLADADLMIIFTRFRDLPEEQMAHIDAYLTSGRPVIGLRTATHAFNKMRRHPFHHYSNGYDGEEEAWHGGFGRLVLGEQWINHHGQHKHDSTRGIFAPGAEDHPILRGIEDGAIWGPTDVYGVRLPLPGDSAPLVLGQVVARAGAYDENDPFFGMRPEDSEPIEAKNDPMMPIAWTKSYEIPGGEQGKVFTTTMGSSTDFVNAPLRRLLVNSVYWALDLSDALPEDGAAVDLVGDFEPSAYNFHNAQYWRDRNVKPADLNYSME